MGLFGYAAVLLGNAPCAIQVCVCAIREHLGQAAGYVHGVGSGGAVGGLLQAVAQDGLDEDLFARFILK